MNARVLTAPGEIFELAPAQREIVAYLDDNRLFISKTHVFNAHVRAFQAKLERMGRTAEVSLVDMKKIAEFYENNASSGNDASGSAGESKIHQDAQEIFGRAVFYRASDIHIRVSRVDKTQIYFRVHNDLEFIEEHSYDYGIQLCTSIYQSISDVSDALFHETACQDARIGKRENLPKGVDGIRIATTPQVGGVVMVLRLLYNDSTSAYSLESKGYSKQQADAVHYMRRRPTGVNIISGPTGSGKSTTLQGVLSMIHQEAKGKKHIITVEDPPEYPILGAVQTPVTNADDEDSRSAAFQKSIKAALRLDPDVIMIGEVRDAPAAKLAIQAAMTGHQVWTSMHTNGALACFDRLVDLGVPRDLIADPSIISGLISQRLVKKLCSHCKRPFMSRFNDYSPEDQRRIISSVEADKAFVMGEGCEHCKGSGIEGRIAVAEVVVTDHTLMTFVRNNDKKGALDYWRREQRGVSMLDSAIDLVNLGLIDPFQAEDVVGPLTSGLIESDHRVGLEELSRGA